MLNRFLRDLLIIISITLISCSSEMRPGSGQHNFVIVVHGGAGNIDRSLLDEKTEKAYRQALQKALDEGYKVLEKGGSSLDAVQAAVVVLEDSPLFNAGKGSVTNREGGIEMDASIMEGSGKRAGAVALVSGIKNPVIAARAVMEKTSHVLLTGNAAEELAEDMGLPIMPPSYFTDGDASLKDLHNQDLGTVGAVAVDLNGNVSAATSTGGLAGKMQGRIGDSPIIGAGTYASDRSCAVSCTGQGEYFIRLAAAKEISALIQHRGYSLEKACQKVIHGQLTEIGGKGGVIAVDPGGNVAFAFNTTAMFRGYRDQDKTYISVFRD